MCCRHATPWTTVTKVQPLFTVDPVNTLVVDVPALPSQQYMDPLIAVAEANGSNFTDSLPQRPIIRITSYNVCYTKLLRSNRSRIDTMSSGASVCTTMASSVA